MIRSALVLCILSSSVATAAAQSKRRIVAVLDVHVEGVPKEIAEKFQTDLEHQLDSNAYWLAPMARVHQLMEASTKWTEGCVVGGCLAEVKTQTGAELVVLAALTGSGTSFGYVVTLVRTDSGEVVAQETERCDVCTVKEALTGATLAAVRLVTAAPEQLPNERAERAAEVQKISDQAVATGRTMQRQFRRAGLATTLVGLAIGIAGMALYVTQDHADWALGVTTGGVGVAGAGVVMLTF